MMIGVIGRKVGMTRIFDESGASTPVTAVEVLANRVTQVKKVATDGYSAVQVTTGERRPIRVKRPQIGHFSKANTKAGRGIWELNTAAESDLTAGAEIGLEQFKAGLMVDVTGTSKGKGFAGPVKRWNFTMQDATHGNSLSHRVGGSIGQCQTPGRVFKGKKMAGRMGNERVTVQNLEIIRVDTGRNLLLIKGAIPGATNSDVAVRPAIKTAASNASVAATSRPQARPEAPVEPAAQKTQTEQEN